MISSTHLLLMCYHVIIGVLMWEVFSGGEMPYGRKINAHVVEEVTRGMRLHQPKDCPSAVYDIMFTCWAQVMHHANNTCLTGVVPSLFWGDLCWFGVLSFFGSLQDLKVLLGDGNRIIIPQGNFKFV